MKKIIALLLAVMMVVGLAACASSGNTATKGALTMATNAQFPPYEYYEGDKIVGIDAEIAGAIADKLGLELIIEDMEFDSIIEAVKSGKADIGMAGMTVTPERQEAVNFTATYATGKQVIIVAEGSEITSVDDLSNVGGYVIGVQRNTTGDLYTTWDLEDAGLATIDRYSKGADAVQALLTGKVDCVVIDNEPANAFVAEAEGLTILETEYVTEDYAGAMSKDNEKLYEDVNKALEELIADGTVQKIIDKYISAN
ncbi:MAG: amino acid ABC transporter substrate-binding protein [Ruminococcaceae bacterium]|nr:amino acid ABC transporter substrate-binding protein [Oscillospiraceae bacterium]